MTEIADFRRFEANGRVLVVASDFAEDALELDLLKPGGLEKARAGGEVAGRGRSLTHTLALDPAYEGRRQLTGEQGILGEILEIPASQG